MVKAYVKNKGDKYLEIEGVIGKKCFLGAVEVLLISVCTV
jgi:hypothetical protein